MSNRTKKVLITGGAGFIGYYLAKRLSEDVDTNITLLDNLWRGRLDSELESLLKRRNVRLIEADITDFEFLSRLDKDFTHIYHLAAIIGVKNITQNPDKALYVNGVSVLNIFEYAKSLKELKKVFFSSTSEVYAGTMRHFGIDIPTDERVVLSIDDLTSNRAAYAVSKIYGESIAFVYGRKYKIPVIVGRYHNIYGPRMGYAHVIPETFIKINKSSGTLDVASPNHTRAFCFIDDAVEFTLRVSEAEDIKGEILNIGNSSQEIRIKDLTLEIANIMGKQITINELDDTPGSPSRRCPDISKIVRLTGYTPSVSLAEGIRRTYRWYEDKLNGYCQEYRCTS